MILWFALGFAWPAIAEMDVPPPPGALRPTITFPIFRMRVGDDPRWADPKYDDSDWTVLNRAQMPARKGIYWVRLKIDELTPVQLEPDCELAGSAADPRCDSIFTSSVFSYELYWDGELLDRNGKVGTDRKSEQTGPLEHFIRIPGRHLGPGPHVLALRVSSFNYNFDSDTFALALGIAHGDSYNRRLTRSAWLPLISFAGAVLLGPVFFVVWWLGDARRLAVLGGLLSVLVALFYWLVAWRWIQNLDYTWLRWRLEATAIVFGLAGVALNALLMEQFSFPWRRRLFAGLAVAMVVAWNLSSFYEFKALWLCRATLVASLVITGWAASKSRRGALALSVGLLAALFLVRGQRVFFLNPSFFAVFNGVVLFLLASVAWEARRARERARQATLTAARLEIELLKKNLQPHFLLNTLATIMEVIEQNPSAATELIEALAGEFRILARVSGEKLIPLASELELCRAHIAIMSRRAGVRGTFSVREVDESALVPPALFHTLVENGFTHLAPLHGQLHFELTATRDEKITRYRFVTRGVPRHDERDTLARMGTGTRYIKARLDESFAGEWTMTAGPIADGWETLIVIPTVLAPTKPASGAQRKTIAATAKGALA